MSSLHKSLYIELITVNLPLLLLSDSKLTSKHHPFCDRVGLSADVHR